MRARALPSAGNPGHDRRMVNIFTARAHHAYQVVVRYVWALVWVVVVGAVGALITFRDELLPDDIKTNWRLLKMAPHWDWGWWVLVVAAVLLCVILEASFRLKREVEIERDGLAGKLDEIGQDRALAWQTFSWGGDGTLSPTSLGGVGIKFENISQKMIEYNFSAISVYCEGNRVALQEGYSGGFINHGQSLTYSVQFSPPIELKLPLTITVEFEIEYDNVPAINKRVVGRRVCNLIHILSPFTVTDTIENWVER